MVIVPGMFVFVANPRTGSRSVGAALETYAKVKGLTRAGCRHSPRSAVPVDLGLPVYGFTREPVRHVLSWWYFQRQKKHIDAFNEEVSRLLTFEEFIRKPFFPLNTLDFPQQRLNLYEGIVTKWFRLEDGIEAFFEEVGLGHINDKLTRRDYIGRSGVNEGLITQETRGLVNAYFPYDCALWKRVNRN